MKTYIDPEGDIWILDHFVKIYTKNNSNAIYAMTTDHEEFIIAICESQAEVSEQLDYLLRCLGDPIM